jgi:hypothetical protein
MNFVIFLFLSTLTHADTVRPKARPAVAEVKVTARGLNVRSSDGEILCSVPRGTKMLATGRHSDGERIRVKINKRGCPNDGFVSATYVRPTGDGEKDSLVDAEGLSLRSAPVLDDSSWECALPRNFRVSTIPDSSIFKDEVSWVKVSLEGSAPKGCPTEGYVAEPYLRSVVKFDGLPLVATDQDCETGNCGGKQGPGVNEQEMDKLGKELGKAIPDEGPASPFVDGLKAMIKNRKAKPAGFKVNRGLLQFPVVGNRGPCGSFNYNPRGGTPNPNHIYINPLTACVFTSVLQDWKKNTCPSHRAGCRVAFGHISHKSDPSFGGAHKTHTDGYCIDIRPMREGSFENAGLTYRSGDYDRDMMLKLVSKLRKAGGSNIYFNDPKVRSANSGAVKKAGGHDNHIHVCFKNNERTRDTCNNLTVDPNVCPELQ